MEPTTVAVEALLDHPRVLSVNFSHLREQRLQLRVRVMGPQGGVRVRQFHGPDLDEVLNAALRDLEKTK